MQSSCILLILLKTLLLKTYKEQVSAFWVPLLQCRRLTVRPQAEHSWPQLPHLHYRNDNTGIAQRQFSEGHSVAIQMLRNHELDGKKSAMMLTFAYKLVLYF